MKNRKGYGMKIIYKTLLLFLVLFGRNCCAMDAERENFEAFRNAYQYRSGWLSAFDDLKNDKRFAGIRNASSAFRDEINRLYDKAVEQDRIAEADYDNLVNKIAKAKGIFNTGEITNRTAYDKVKSYFYKMGEKEAFEKVLKSFGEQTNTSAYLAIQKAYKRAENEYKNAEKEYKLEEDEEKQLEQIKSPYNISEFNERPLIRPQTTKIVEYTPPTSGMRTSENTQYIEMQQPLMTSVSVNETQKEINKRLEEV